ncbi:hypothetical protein KSC_030350 [Ktedonobacter sp. SOSP1-52]|nr:hypothetical protein KSC_030350 [Ktedonobacter sp. SOSP1-52]
MCPRAQVKWHKMHIHGLHGKGETKAVVPHKLTMLFFTHFKGEMSTHRWKQIEEMIRCVGLAHSW